MSESVFGTDWFASFVAFRSNPSRFLDKRKLSRDAFCMDMLKDLYSDEVPAQCKFHLLLAVQSESSWLIQDEALLEQIVGSLKNLYITIQNIDEKKLLKSQIFITITTILLSWPSLNSNVSALIISVQTLMLEAILNESKDHVLRSTLCRCLEEMETFFPGILKTELDVLLSACQNPSLNPVQSYVILLSKCLDHKTDLQRKSISNLPEEHSMLIMEKDGHSYSHGNNEVQVHAIVSTILELLSNMNETSSYLVLQNLVQIVENTAEILPTVFKPFLMKLIMSSDILYLHLAFCLLRSFGLQLFSTQEEKLLLRQLLMCIHNPSLTISHRLLFMDWLETCIIQKGFITLKMQNPELYELLPGPFDGPYSQEKKLRLLALYFQSHYRSGSCSEFLMLAIAGLQKQTTLSSNLKPVTSFFRSLFVVFSTLKDVKLHSDIQKLIMGMVLFAPRFSLHVLDFLKCVKHELDNGKFCDSTLGVITEHITNLSTKQLALNILNFIPILEVAAEEAPDLCKPQVVLRQVKKMLMEHSNNLGEDAFVTGHCILSLCCVFLKFHDIESLYHDLGELLHVVMMKIDDVDVQGRAKQIYGTLTSLPKTVVKGLFMSQMQESNLGHNLTTLVSGTDHLHSRTCTVKLPNPVFSLNRLLRTDYSSKMPKSLKVNNFTSPKTVEAYHDFVNSESFQPTVSIPFSLELLDDVDEKFSCLFGILITVQTSPAVVEVSDITVPVLKKDGKGTIVHLELLPKVACPHLLNLNAQFTCRDGVSYSFEMPNIQLNFEDLFLLIPVPDNQETDSETSTCKENLFDMLWTDKNFAKYSTCSSLCDIDEDIHTFVKKQWEPFVMNFNSDQNALYCIGIFLPPLSHLLVKLSMVNGAIFTKILTDNLTILAWIGIYLRQLGNIQSNKT